MTGQRKALIIAGDEYTDSGLSRLRAPASDARELAAVLQDPGIGGFEVRTLLNEPAHEVNLALEEFFADRQPSDLLLVHFSCHGVKDEDGELYFAMANTLLPRLRATAVAAEFVNRLMNRSRSRRVVLLLDCCYAGAFEHGMKPRAGRDMGIGSQFRDRVITAGGRGRAVITASSAMEYALEGDELVDASESAPSVFTSALVEGLETGDADLDQDGLVALDELYDYIYDKVRAATPHQTPGKWTFGVEGELIIARRARPVTAPAPLPPELQQAANSPLASVRAAAVQDLARLAGGNHAGRALAAQLALQQLAHDDSRSVAAAAAAALSPQTRPPAPPRLQLSATAVDFGRTAYRARPPERRIRLGNTGGGDLNARVTTQAKWLKLRQEGGDLVLTIDTTAIGKHQHAVTVESDGGSAVIHVQALVEPALQAAATPPGAAGPPGAGPVVQHDPGLSPASPRSAATLPRQRPARPAKPPRLRRTWIAIAVVALAAAAGGVYLVVGRGGGGGGGAAGGRHTNTGTPALALPPCTTRTAPLKLLPGVHTHFVHVGGKPYGVVVSTSHFGFVSLRNDAPLVVMNTSRFVPAVAQEVPLADSEGEAFARDQRYLLVAEGSGAKVFRVRDLEAGRAALAGPLTSPRGQFALQVVPSPDGNFVFVAMQNSGNVAVFNLAKALAQGFGPADFVGMIPITGLPTGMAVSPDGRRLYVVSRPGIPVGSGMGTLAVIDLRMAETTPRSSVIKNDSAGCGSARVLASPGGKYVWVTAAGGNALEAFSATRLLSDPRHALVARVAVGAAPFGLALVDDGSRMVVADSSDGSTGTGADLAVVNVPKALAHQPAVVGAILSRGRPHQFALEPGGKTLLVTNTGSGEVQAVNVAQLP